MVRRQNASAHSPDAHLVLEGRSTIFAAFRSFNPASTEAGFFFVRPAHSLGGETPLHVRQGVMFAGGKGDAGDRESAGSAGLTNRTRIRGDVSGRGTDRHQHEGGDRYGESPAKVPNAMRAAGVIEHMNDQLCEAHTVVDELDLHARLNTPVEHCIGPRHMYERGNETERRSHQRLTPRLSCSTAGPDSSLSSISRSSKAGVNTPF
ncbi:hypothetical protein AWB78_08492 [Caballeronia calidae]|uniref:Uncharacterized protein n=1 Tax=Caballeronia calidae TaxID=1777139 RepID=A0A158EKB1_9BURK|nr:hypothetical protein AWB78_08492 [Caballeronia calidae]